MHDGGGCSGDGLNYRGSITNLLDSYTGNNMGHVTVEPILRRGPTVLATPYIQPAEEPPYARGEPSMRFWRQFFAAAIAAPPPSRGDITGRSEIVFRPAAHRNRHWFFTVSAFVQQRTILCFRASSALAHTFCYFCPPALFHAAVPTTGVSLRWGTSTDCVLFSLGPQVSHFEANQGMSSCARLFVF